MNSEVPKGTLVIAVSGGVDSMCLLHMLHSRPKSQRLIVAHVNHGIRTDSDRDEYVVKQIAQNYGLEFFAAHLKLGPQTSEATARTARYAYLRVVAAKTKASAIVTAHHQDDLVETILLHVQRGTGRHGLTPMQTRDVYRPLLQTSKKELLAYAKKHKITWREDSTNDSNVYARNKLRSSLKKANPDLNKLVIKMYDTMLSINNQIDELMIDIYKYAVANNYIVRSRFVVLPYVIQKELMYVWLKQNNITIVQQKLVERAVIACKTLNVHKKISLTKNIDLVSQQNLIKILQK